MAEVFKINDIEYECEFKLSNPDNQEVTFTKSSVRVMDISDNVFDPFVSGSITLANPFDYMENDYFLRGDGRDEFYIMFKPKEDKGWKNTKFEHTFYVVDDIDIVNPEVRSENHKELKLASIDMRPFMDEIPYNTLFTGKIGDILKDLFKELLGEDRVDEEKWESGDFEMSFIPPSNFRYIDVLRYMLMYFYAKDDDLYVKGFIHHNDETDKYELHLLSKIFKEHKEHQLEAFGVGDLVTEVGFDNPNNPDLGSATPTGEYIGQLRSIGYSTPLYEWINEYFINYLVIGYNSILGQQIIEKISFEDTKEKWKKVFVESFSQLKGKPKPFAVKNQTTNKKFKRFKFPYSVKDGRNLVEAEMINSLTFYNLQLTFSNIGNSSRRSGKFIDIYSPRKDEKELKSHQKLLGRWYVTKVRHIFNGDLYINEMYSTKTYIGPNSKIDEEVE